MFQLMVWLQNNESDFERTSKCKTLCVCFARKNMKTQQSYCMIDCSDLVLQLNHEDAVLKEILIERNKL